MNEATINEQMRAAAGMRQAGRTADARRVYEQILAANPMHAPSLFYLSSMVAADGRPSEAIEMLRRAITIEPNQAAYHYELGNLLSVRGTVDAALSCYLRALELKPNFFQASNQAGLMYQRRGENEQAERHFRDAVRANPNYAKGLNNLGNVLKAKKELKEALQCFEAAVKVQPDYYPAYVNLGETLEWQGRVEEASDNYAKAIQLRPNEFYPYVKLGMTLVVETKLEEAEVIMRRALELKPDDVGALVNLGYALKEQGKYEEALVFYERATKQNEQLLVAAIGANLSLPPIYKDENEIHAVRKRYSEGLDRLRANAHLYKQRPMQALTLVWGNFLLAYQGLNDCDLQRRYGEFLGDLLRNDAPEFFEPMELKVEPGRRIRVGILSSLFRSCTVGSYFKSWITALDKSKIELFVYFTGHGPDIVTKEIQDASDHFMHLVGRTPGIARRVKQDALDILVYPEIGMDAGVCTLASLRLAPVQCAAWGHPTTSGYPNIDYYFSSALMEPPNAAAEHYTEKLVLLDGLGTCYKQPPVPEGQSRADFGLPEDRTLYFCPQSLFKIHPRNDEVLVSIVERDPKATLVFFQGMFTESTNIFMRRLERLFDARGIAKTGRVKLLPRLGHAEYLSVNRVCDVMLDTLYWSGGNTSLDALACGLPIVTLPGEMMRGRQSYGMLTAMGIPELIARDTDDYIEIALRLGQDSAWREQISQRIKDSTHRIFGKTEPIRDLERFFTSFMPAG
jgi:protein O-GlcNAc transferase